MTPEYAKEAGLLARDMPSPHHPLMQNDDEIRDLADLVEARDDRTRDDTDTRLLTSDDDDMDVSDALTFPHVKKRPTSADLTPDLSGFDADARTRTKPDDEDDASYMTRADMVDAMNATDPDPNTGADEGEFIGDANLDRAPDMTGTVTGIARGMSTHLPQDIGRDGFQIEEPEAMGDPRALDPDAEAENDSTALVNGLEDEFDPDGGRIATDKPNVNNRDEALDATRRLR